MIRLVCFLGFIAAMTLGLAWLADRPGNLVLDWQGTRIETSVFLAVVLSMLTVGSALVLWSIGVPAAKGDTRGAHQASGKHY